MTFNIPAKDGGAAFVADEKFFFGTLDVGFAVNNPNVLNKIETGREEFPGNLPTPPA